MVSAGGAFWTRTVPIIDEREIQIKVKIASLTEVKKAQIFLTEVFIFFSPLNWSR